MIFYTFVYLMVFFFSCFGTCEGGCRLGIEPESHKSMPLDHNVFGMVFCIYILVMLSHFFLYYYYYTSGFPFSANLRY